MLSPHTLHRIEAMDSISAICSVVFDAQWDRFVPPYAIDWQSASFSVEAGLTAALAVLQAAQQHSQTLKEREEVKGASVNELWQNVGLACAEYASLRRSFEELGCWAGTVHASISRLPRSSFPQLKHSICQLSAMVCDILDTQFTLLDAQLLKTASLVEIRAGIRKAPAPTLEMPRSGQYGLASPSEINRRMEGRFFHLPTMWTQTEEQRASDLNDCATKAFQRGGGLNASAPNDPVLADALKTIVSSCKLAIESEGRIKPRFEDLTMVYQGIVAARVNAPKLLSIDLDEHDRLKTNDSETFLQSVIDCWTTLHSQVIMEGRALLSDV